MRALIVEDETTPRELLLRLVNWSGLGFDQVETARNGLEALEVLSRGGIDVLLTDVRMPRMDGISLAVSIRDRWPDTVLIFLSGHSEKEYLKSAIRLQASDYLDKPIEIPVVEAALSRAGEEVRKRRASTVLLPLRRQASALTLFGLSTGVVAEPFQTDPLRVIVVRPGPGRTAPPAWGPSVVDLVNSDLFVQPRFAAALVEEQTVAMVADGTLSSCAADFDRAVAELLGRISVLGDVEPHIGVAPALPRNQIAHGLALARTALSDGFYRPSVCIHPSRPTESRPFEFSPEAQAAWRPLMETSDYSAILRQFDHLEQRALALRDPDLDRVRRAWYNAIEFVLPFVPAWGPGECQARLQKLEGDLLRSWSLGEMAEVCRDCFRRLFLQQAGELHTEDRVKKAKEFILTRFSDPDLTVDAVATHVGFSESYFCTLFKQTAGTTVKDYVTQLRIERAKAYLWEKTPPTLADLALRVGYRDPNYFSTVFKRLTGTSPGAYRKRALG